MKPEQAWQAVLGQLQMDMPKASFDTWVRNTEVISYEDNVFIIGVPNAYARDWLESRLSSKIKTAVMRDYESNGERSFHRLAGRNC